MALVRAARPAATTRLSETAFARAGLQRGAARLHESALDALSTTPLIKLRHMAPPDVDVYVKCEGFNPMLSMKDRLSAGMVEWAQIHGHLESGQAVVEALSGSSGLGLALACKEHGHPLVAVVPDGSVVEWQRLLRFMGAKVLITSDENPDAVAAGVASRNGWFWAGPHRSEANEWTHANKTAPQILDALGERPLSYFISPHGTGGMLRGVGRVLRARSPATRICVVEQDSRPHPDYEAAYGPHPSWPGELLEGFTTDFDPTPIQQELRARYVDETITISGHEAMTVARDLAQLEGIFTGISGGALAAGALRVAQRAEQEASVLAVLLDTSHFILTTPLIDGTPGQMSGEEQALLHERAGPQPAPPKDAHRVDGHF